MFRIHPCIYNFSQFDHLPVSPRAPGGRRQRHVRRQRGRPGVRQPRHGIPEAAVPIVLQAKGRLHGRRG